MWPMTLNAGGDALLTVDANEVATLSKEGWSQVQQIHVDRPMTRTCLTSSILPSSKSPSISNNALIVQDFECKLLTTTLAGLRPACTNSDTWHTSVGMSTRTRMM